MNTLATIDYESGIGLQQAVKLEPNTSMRLRLPQMQALWQFTWHYEKNVVVEPFDTHGLLIKRMMTKVKRRLSKRLLIVKKEYGITLPSEEGLALCEAFSLAPVNGIYEQTIFNQVKEQILRLYA